MQNLLKDYISSSIYSIYGIGVECENVLKMAVSSSNRLDLVQLFNPNSKVNTEVLKGLKSRNIEVIIYIDSANKVYKIDDIDELSCYCEVYYFKKKLE